MGGSNSSNQTSSGSGVGVNSGIGVDYGVNTSGQQSNSNGNSSSFNQSSGTSDIWAGQSPTLQNLYAQNTDQYTQALAGINGLQPEVQQQVQDAYGNAATGMSNQANGGFSAGLQGDVGPNAYTDALKQNIANDAQLLKQQNLGGLDARAAASGMSGSTGYRDQVAKMTNNADENALNQMSQLDFNAQNQGIQNQMQLAQQMNQAQQFGAAGANNLQNAAMNQFNPFMAGMQATGMYGNIIGAPTVLNQSSSSGGSSSSNSSSSSGFSNGMNVGVNMNQGTNVSNNSGNGSSSGWNVQYPG